MWESQFAVCTGRSGGRTSWARSCNRSCTCSGMGLGVGALVDEGSDVRELLDGLTYFQFLGPALIATSAMMVTTSEAMFPVIGRLQVVAHATTPPRQRRSRPARSPAGVALWHATKALITVTGVAAVLLVCSTETRIAGFRWPCCSAL